MIASLAIPAIAKGGYDIYRYITAQKNINALKAKPTPRYMENIAPLQQNKRMYEQQFRQGMSPASRALATQNFASSQAGATRAASEMSGGQMSNAISRLGSLGNANFALNLAAQNEAVQNQARSGIASSNLQIQSRQDRDTAQKYNELFDMKKQYGAAASEAAEGVLGAAGGYFMGKMNMENAQADRDMYASLYGGDAAAVEDENSNVPLGAPLSLYRKFGTPSQYTSTGGLPNFSLGGKSAGLGFTPKYK